MPVFSILQLETTNHCNQKCTMCARTERPPSKLEHLSLTTFQTLLAETGKMNIQTYVGHNLGEPLLNPQFLEMLEYFDSNFKNKNFTFNTNATLLNDQAIQKVCSLKNNKYQINISLDAAGKTTYQTMHGPQYLKVKNNTKKLLKELVKHKNNNIFVTLGFIIAPQNFREQNKFIALWQSLIKKSGNFQIKFYPLAWNRLLRKKYNFTLWQQTNTIANIFNCQKPRKTTCKKPWETLSIQANGNVTVCCYDNVSQLKIGNIFEEPLAKIIKSKELSSIREQFTNKDYRKLPLCYFCHA